MRVKIRWLPVRKLKLFTRFSTSQGATDVQRSDLDADPPDPLDQHRRSTGTGDGLRPQAQGTDRRRLPPGLDLRLPQAQARPPGGPGPAPGHLPTGPAPASGPARRTRLLPPRPAR